MKALIKNKIRILSIFLLILATGCGEMFDNPLKDKESGEDITVLIVDFNFFTTRMTFKFVDVTSDEEIAQSARVWFTGANADDIVTYAGKKESEHATELGQLELTVDPNVEVSTSSPLDFTVHVEIDGYDEFAQTIQVNSEGKKTFELYLSPTNGGTNETITGGDDPNDSGSFIFQIFGSTKSASVEEKPYVVNYHLLKEEVINFTDVNGQPLYSSVEEMQAAMASYPGDFLQITMNITTGFPAFSGKVWVDDARVNALVKKLESGNLVQLVIGGKKVYNLNGGTITQSCTYTGEPAPDIFGFAKVVNDAWLISQTPNVYYNLNISYLVASASLVDICSIGATINFSSSVKSSFSIDADIYNESGQRIATTNFTGSFPESFNLENVPDLPATIVFRNNNPGFKEIAPLEVSSLCSGSYDVDVEAADGYVEFFFTLKAFCSDDPTVAVAPTYSAEIRIKDSGDDWQGIDMEGGTVDILAKENETYEFRFVWEDSYETDEFTTEFDTDGNYLGDSKGSKITSGRMEDGRIKIMVEHTFEQDVCDELNW